MKIKSGFILREMDDMNIVVAVGDKAKAFNGVVTLNPTAVTMWKALEKGCTRDELVEAVLAEYNAPKEKVETDADAFILKLREADFIDE